MIRIRTRHLLPALLTSATLLVGYGTLQFVLPAASQSKPRVPQAQLAATEVTSQPIARTWMPPDLSKIPAGPEGQNILLGMHIFEETPRYTPNNAGNQLSCGSCHLQGGTMSFGISLVGAPTWFPMWSVRAKRNITIEDRIQECQTRSENGTPFPQGGREVTALIAYLQWITDQAAAEGVSPVRGLDAKIPDLQGDATRGEAIYSKQCSGCHGEDGAGVPGVLPALWGPGSYNNGAGMNQPKKMAAFVLHNMPQNNPGKLTPQEAWDVSTYVASKPHSKYNSAYDNY